MKSFSKKVVQLQQKKTRLSKIRNKAIRSLKTARKLHKKSTSTINSIQRRVSKIHAELDDVSNALQHSIAQKESIQRLKINAEERLKQEKERKKEIEKELSSIWNRLEKDRASKVTSDYDFRQLQFTLGAISDHINEIRNEIRQRNSTARKVEKIIEGCDIKKSKLCSQIKRATKSKPRIIKIMNESKKNVAKLEKRLPSLTKTEKNIRKNFSRINSVIREQAKRKKVSQAKSQRDKSRKAAEARRIQNLARKLATQMLAGKRKASKMIKAKRKAPKKTKAKRKAPKKTKAKRKASRKRR